MTALRDDRAACTDFIIETARMIRRNPKTLQGGEAGVGLRRLHAAIRKSCSEEVFRNGIAALLENGQAILICRVWDTADEGENPDRSSFTKPPVQRIDALPEGLPAGQYGKWALDKDGRIVDRHKADNYISYEEPRLYIVADGLPKSIKRFANRPDKTQ